MTINVPTLGPNWIPKVGGLLGVLSAALETVPATAPGMGVIRPWLPFLSALAIGLVGFSTRQSNKTSEQSGLVPQPQSAAVTQTTTQTMPQPAAQPNPAPNPAPPKP